MIQFIRERKAFWVFVAVWILFSSFFPFLLYIVLPLSVLLMWRNDMWEEMVLGFFLCVILSDMDPKIHPVAVMKTAKNVYILTLAFIFFRDQARFRPMARAFYIFLPFILYSFLPIVVSPAPLVAFQKTVSYGLIFLVIPNLVLHNFRLAGWSFFRNLIYFFILVLLVQKVLPFAFPNEWFYIAGRFRGLFGNPNGLALFCYLVFMLVAVVDHLRPGLLVRGERMLAYGLLIYYIITCGARTSLVSTLMFVLFIQFFRISTLLGIISFIAFIGVTELVSSNLAVIITTLGLEDYMRVDTIADGSGRYVAWNYAWGLITTQGYFFFGAGFDNEYFLMTKAWRYLSTLGHQGGVHNTYLAFWLNTGIVGLLLFLRGFFLIFIKATKNTSISMAIMFSVLFSILYESWLAGSLSPYTSSLLVILTVVSEYEIFGAANAPLEPPAEADDGKPKPAPLILPAR